MVAVICRWSSVMPATFMDMPLETVTSMFSVKHVNWICGCRLYPLHPSPNIIISTRTQWNFLQTYYDSFLYCARKLSRFKCEPLYCCVETLLWGIYASLAVRYPYKFVVILIWTEMSDIPLAIWQSFIHICKLCLFCETSENNAYIFFTNFNWWWS